jgi:hypothetical protein
MPQRNDCADTRSQARGRPLCAAHLDFGSEPAEKLCEPCLASGRSKGAARKSKSTAKSKNSSLKNHETTCGESL